MVVILYHTILSFAPLCSTKTVVKHLETNTNTLTQHNIKAYAILKQDTLLIYFSSTYSYNGYRLP